MSTERVRMPSRPMMSVIRDDDVAATALPPSREGRRFTLDVTDELLTEGGKEALAYAFDDLCKRIANEQRPLLESEAMAWITSTEHRDEVKALVRRVIEETVRAWITDVLNTSPLAQVLR